MTVSLLEEIDLYVYFYENPRYFERKIKIIYYNINCNTKYMNMEYAFWESNF